MKKWLIGIACLLIISLLCVYIFIPSRLKIVRRIQVQCNANGAFRFLAEPGNWAGRWPGVAVTGQLSHLVYINIRDKDTCVLSRMLILPRTTPDSAEIQWDCELQGGMDPFTRLMRYRHAVAVSEQMDGILSKLRTFLENKSNVYGLDIRDGATTDSFVLATRTVLPEYPRTPEVYGLITRLQGYAASEHALQTGYPMLNVTRLGDGQFQVMTAIPTDRAVKGNGVFYGRNLVKGRYLLAEVKGGSSTVNAAIGQLQNYMQDYQRTEMAIPFQSLITDRIKEPDSSRWITRIYYPVY